MGRLVNGRYRAETVTRVVSAAAQWDELIVNSITVLQTPEQGKGDFYVLEVNTPKHTISTSMAEMQVEMQYGPTNNKLYFATACSATSVLKYSSNLVEYSDHYIFNINARMRSGF
jgi:hypothetical protein